MGPVRNKGLATAPPRTNTRFQTLMGPTLRPSLTVWTTGRNRSRQSRPGVSRGGVIWAPKKRPIASDDRKVRSGRLSSGGQAFYPGWSDQRREHSEPERSKPESVNDHQKTVLRLEETRARRQVGCGRWWERRVRGRTWIRVVRVAPPRSPATSATTVGEVGELSSDPHFTSVNVRMQRPSRLGRVLHRPRRSLRDPSHQMLDRTR